MNSQADFHLAQHEERLLQYLDGRLLAPEARALETHLAACPKCQALRREWEPLEPALVRAFAQTRLSPDFADRLRRRVLAETEAGAAAARLREHDEPAAQAQPAWSGGQPRRLPQWFKLLDGIGWGAVAIIGGYFLFELALAWVPAASLAGVAFLRSSAFALALATAMAALLFGANLAAQNRLLRWLGGS